MPVTSDVGSSSILEKFLGQGDLFGIKYNTGTVYLEVDGWTQTKYDPYTKVGEIDPKSGSGFQRLVDQDGDDILFTEKREQKVKHVSIGVSPSQIRRYTNYPEDQNRLRQINNIGSPVTGDDFGFVDGDDSPYEAPTEAEELMIPPGQHLNFNFYNPDNRARKATAKIMMRQYNIAPLDPNNSSHRNAITRIESPGSPMPIYPAGSSDNQVRYDLQNYWGVSPLSDSEINDIVGQ